MESETRFLTVTQLNEYIKMLMDSNPILKNVWIKAEISNFTNHYRTGHFYFSLKDDNALIKAVMFKSYASNVNFALEDGMKVLVHGRISSFVRDGQYQIYVDEILPDGAGALYLAFEQLKRKLEAEGLFDERRKKPLPRIPSRIGIVTSPTGAAIRDMINVLGRRFPCVQIYIYPAQVQGASAAPQIAEGIKHFNNTKGADVLIVGRGGGSAEDLWAFNDEALARVIAASDIPVISAVGHESDFTICDFVADKRAPTPSAAAELAVPDAMELKAYIEGIVNRLSSSLLGKITSYRRSLKYLAESAALSDSSYLINDKRMELLRIFEKLDLRLEKRVEDSKNKFGTLLSKLEALSPVSVLSRGYGFVLDEGGKTVKTVDGILVGQRLNVHVLDGDLGVTVTDVNKEE